MNNIVINLDGKFSTEFINLLIGKYVKSRSQIFESITCDAGLFFLNISKIYGNESKLIFVDNIIYNKNSKSDQQLDRLELVYDYVNTAKALSFKNIKIVRQNILIDVLENSRYVDSSFETSRATMNLFFLAIENYLPIEASYTYLKYCPIDKHVLSKLSKSFLTNIKDIKLSTEEAMNDIDYLKSLEKNLYSYNDIIKYTKNKHLIKYAKNKYLSIPLKITMLYLKIKDYSIYLRYRKKLEKSVLFDKKFYQNQYPDLANCKSMVKHFILHGIDEGRVCSRYYVNNINRLREEYNSLEQPKNWKIFLLSQL